MSTAVVTREPASSSSGARCVTVPAPSRLTMDFDSFRILASPKSPSLGVNPSAAVGSDFSITLSIW
jgi:hypothetical protein